MERENAMSGKPIPKRVQVDGKWYDVREGWAGALNLCEWNTPKYTAREPYAHISHLYFVYDTDGVKVGEFDINNMTCSGGVNNFEMPVYRPSGGGSSSSSSSDGDAASGCIAIILFVLGYIVAFIVSFIIKSRGGRIGALIGLVCCAGILIIEYVSSGGSGGGDQTAAIIFGVLLFCVIGGVVGAVIDKIVSFIRERSGGAESTEIVSAGKGKKGGLAVFFVALGVVAVVLTVYFISQSNRVYERNRHIAAQSNSEVEEESGYFIDSRDGQKYRVVKIGGKVWMDRNLNYQPPAGRSWCYDNGGDGCVKYGRLYDWSAASSACPTGWHLPDRQEWNNLSAAAGGNTAGRALKTRADWIENGGGTDAYGFSALPGGSRSIDGSFKNAGNRGLWWAATEYDSDSAYYRRMGYNYDYVYEGTYGKGHGFSVRCVQ